MVHISEVVKEIIKRIVLMDLNGASGDTLFNTLRIKLQRHRVTRKPYFINLAQFTTII